MKQLYQMSKSKSILMLLILSLVLLLGHSSAYARDVAGNAPAVDAVSAAEPEVLQEEIYSGTGRYTGLADSHTLEIIRAGSGAAAFQFGEELHEAINRLPEHSRVRFKYRIHRIEGENTVQLFLVSITEEKTRIARHCQPAA
jgi:hypothetical protein